MREQKLPPIPSKQAEKYLKKLDAKTRNRLGKGIVGIPVGDVKPLEGATDYFRLTIGDYRIIYKWVSDSQIFISRIDPRGDIYKGAW